MRKRSLAEKKIFRCYPRNASIGSVLERGVYSIYSHDYSRALYFADRATLSIDFFRYGNWDSGVDLTVLGYPLSFFSRPGCPWTWKITVKIINQGRMTVDRSPLLSFRSFHETRRYRETLHNISSRVVTFFFFLFFLLFSFFFFFANDRVRNLKGSCVKICLSRGKMDRVLVDCHNVNCVNKDRGR